MTQKRTYQIVFWLILIAMVLSTLACGGGVLTGKGGGCADVYCISLYGSAVGETKSEAKSQAVNYLYDAMQRKNRCGGNGPVVVREVASGGSWLVEAKMYDTVNCDTGKRL